MDKEISLEKYLVELRRIREHRTKGAEKEIRVIYKALLRDLQAHIGKYYSKYGEDDKLSYEILYRKGKFARFLEEVERKLNDISPKTKKIIRQTVEETYKNSYEGMVKAVAESADSRELQEAAQKLGSLDGDTVKRMVDNPISGLTLKDTLEKNRKDIIYDIKRNIGVGLMNGDRYTTMSRRIADSLDGDYKKAVRIVRTETKRTGEGGTYDFYARIDKKLQDGGTGQRIQKTWHTAQDQKVRPGRGISKKPSGKANHQKMDGQKLLIDEKFDLGRGVKTLCPGNSGDAANDINCRCWLSYSFITVENPEESGTIKAQENPVQKVDLSPNEEYAINQYIGSKSYALNEKMRKGYQLDKDEQDMVKYLVSALQKMPVYKGIVKRSVSITAMSVEERKRFEELHQVRKMVTYEAFTSTSTGVYDPSFEYQFVITSKSGRDIRTYNEHEMEILFPPDTTFCILKREGNTIYMKEV